MKDERAMFYLLFDLYSEAGDVVTSSSWHGLICFSLPHEQVLPEVLPKV